jgi:hypothetical protein
LYDARICSSEIVARTIGSRSSATPAISAIRVQ